MNKSNESIELQDALEQVDEIVDGIGEIIIEIATANDDFICTQCLKTAYSLFQIMENYAREEDCDRIAKQFHTITGRYIDE